MKCQHEDILTRRYVDNNDVAMWVCAECKMRFEPASALDKAFREGAKYEREECASLCELEASVTAVNATERYQEGRTTGANVCAKSIRARSRALE